MFNNRSEFLASLKEAAKQHFVKLKQSKQEAENASSFNNIDVPYQPGSLDRSDNQEAEDKSFSNVDASYEPDSSDSDNENFDSTFTDTIESEIDVDSDDSVADPTYELTNSTEIESENEDAEPNIQNEPEVESEIITDSTGDHTLNDNDIPKKKRKIEKMKKDHGLKYTNRKGKEYDAKVFKSLINCCKRKCYLICPPDIQKELFTSFYVLSVEEQQQVLISGVSISEKKVERKRPGKSKKQYNREITAIYTVKVAQKRVQVCKKMYQTVYGITRGKVDVLVKKIKKSGNELPAGDNRGRHEAANKMVKQRELMKSHLEEYPKYQSHYSRRDSSKFYLNSNLNIKKIYNTYQEKNKTDNFECGSYELFKEVFKASGYKFKKPKVDTCKTCDMFKLKLNQCKNDEEKTAIELQRKKHQDAADLGYIKKRDDKTTALDSPTKRVLVFDLQKVLDTPCLTANVSFYKRLLSTYNLTIRDCSEKLCDCFMWHEGVAKRGSEDIASCLYKKLLSLPPIVSHVTTYSDSCVGQNRNFNMSVMLSYFVTTSLTVQTVDQKFLLPGHTHLECDVDHARIEKSKKFTEIDIMVPRDWYQFVKTVRGKKPFVVHEMTKNDFFSFSKFLSSHLVKQTITADGSKVNWFNIRWIRYEKPFGVIKIKESLEEHDGFKTLDLRRRSGRGRPHNLKNGNIKTENGLQLLYENAVPIHPKKKKDLLSLLPLIHEDFHEFYKNLPTSSKSPEVDESSDEEDK